MEYATCSVNCSVNCSAHNYYGFYVNTAIMRYDW